MYKKILSLLIVLTFLIPVNVFADENVGETQTDTTVTTESSTETTETTETSAESSAETTNDTSTVVEPVAATPVDYDVIVIGGEPEGVAAAVSAARSGSKVLLVDYRSKLGGLLTVSEMNILDIVKNHSNQEISQGIFKEFHNMIGGSLTADIETSTEAFHQLVANEPNITLQLNTTVTNIEVVDGFIKSVTLKDASGESTLTATNFIDATADADLAALAGVPYTYGNEDIGKPDTKMAVTLMMHFENVNWDRMKNYINNNKGVATVYNDAAWGFWDFVADYQEIEPNTNLRGLNIGRDKSGDVYINALQIFNVSGLDPVEKANAIEVGKRETANILKWLQKELPGFENATIADYPQELYIRETRHIEPLYKLSIVDVFENRDQWDKIAFGGYPVDMQATDKNSPNLIVVNPDQYAIPFRSIVPVNIKNLLVTSKASGYESLAAGSARVIPTGMAVGEAGGLASSIAAKNGVNFHEMSENKILISELQNTLRANGAYLPEHSNLSFPYQNAPYYDDMKELYTRGFLHLDYTNNLHENSVVTEKDFYNDMIQILPAGEEKETFLRNFKPSNKEMNLDDARNVFTYLYGPNAKDFLEIPKGNSKLIVKDFVSIKANLVRELYK